MTKRTSDGAITPTSAAPAILPKRTTSAWPVIGVSCPVSYDSRAGNYTYSRPTSYLTAVEASKGIAIPLPPNPDQLDEQVALLDGLVLTGGGDIDPFAYGIETPHRNVYGVSDRRDEYEFALLNAALKAGIPILGICRGLQLINVGFGGTLWQDIDEERPRGTVKLRHTGGGYVAYTGTSHDGGYHMVRVRPDSLMADVYRGDSVQVNSYHHQAVRNLGEGLHICGRTADGVVESIAHNTLPILGLQFHPEMLQSYRHEHKRPFRWLMAEAAKAMRNAGGRRAGIHAEDRGRVRQLRQEARMAERAAMNKEKAQAKAATTTTTSVKPATPSAPAATSGVGTPTVGVNIQTGASVPPAPATAPIPAPYQLGQAAAIAQAATQATIPGITEPLSVPGMPTVQAQAEAAKQAGLAAAANQLVRDAAGLDERLVETQTRLIAARSAPGQQAQASREWQETALANAGLGASGQANTAPLVAD